MSIITRGVLNERGSGCAKRVTYPSTNIVLVSALLVPPGDPGVARGGSAAVLSPESPLPWERVPVLWDFSLSCELLRAPGRAGRGAVLVPIISWLFWYVGGRGRRAAVERRARSVKNKCAFVIVPPANRLRCSNFPRRAHQARPREDRTNHQGLRLQALLVVSTKASQWDESPLKSSA